MSEKRQAVGAAWKKQTSKGEVINLSIKINGVDVRFNMWPNKFKDADNKPDYRIFEDTYHRQEEPF